MSIRDEMIMNRGSDDGDGNAGGALLQLIRTVLGHIIRFLIVLQILYPYTQL
jgi:hypothetical protein